MNEKELLTQLNNLKNIKPDKKWKDTSRDILMSQIYGGMTEKEPVKLTVSYCLRNFFHQPVLMVATILLIVFGSGIFSISASRDTKPGDSLYIAKIISEKAQQAITFNEENKAKLGIEFAGNRAKEISQILAGTGNGDKDAKVEKLTQNFQKEINTVKTRLKKININEDEIDELSGDEEDAQIFSANLGKEERGMEIYVQEEDLVIEESVEGDAGLEEDIVVTTPEMNIDEATSTISVSSDVEAVLEEAEKLFAEQDYNGALEKLEEAMVQIDETEGEVKGETEEHENTNENAEGGAEDEVSAEDGN